MDLDFDFGMEDTLDLFTDTAPFYDSIDLANGIAAMGPLDHAMPSIEQTFGAGFDLSVASKLKEEAMERSKSVPSTPSGEKKRRKKRHRRSISDPEVVRRQIFQAAKMAAEDEEVSMDVEESASDHGGMEVESGKVVDGIMGLEFMDLNMLEDVNVMSDIFNPTRNESYVEEQDMNQTVGSSAASVASSVSDSRRTKRTSSSTKKVNRSRNYACSKCGQPKKGHVCPLAPVSPPKMVSMSTQVDLNVTHIERVLVTRPFRSFSMS
jgi:hypothetical protein